jgi:hypothetical protein
MHCQAFRSESLERNDVLSEGRVGYCVREEYESGIE